MSLIVETGEGLPDSNSYAAIADCDEYHRGHLYATDWFAATDDKKEKALRMATRTIDTLMDFNGSRATQSQALCWPRLLAEDTERALWRSWGFSYGFWNEDPMQNGVWGGYLASNAVPAGIRAATCEMARQLLIADRTKEDDTKGIKSVSLGQGAVSVTLDPADRKKIFTPLVNMMLQPFGGFRGSGFQMVSVRRA